MNINVSLDEQKLIRLFEMGVLHPSDLQCLDGASRDIVKQLCLRLCKPKECRQCEHLEHCMSSLEEGFQSGRVSVALRFDH